MMTPVRLLLLLLLLLLEQKLLLVRHLCLELALLKLQLPPVRVL